MGRRRNWRAMVSGLLVALVVPGAGLAAQGGAWHLAATSAQTWFSGGLKDTTTTETDWSLAPALRWGLTADRSLGSIQLGLGLSYVATNVQLVSDAITITEGTLDIAQWAVTALVTVPLLRFGTTGAGVNITGGPVLGIWTLTDEETRTRLGGTATLQLTAPLASSWHLLATIGGAVSGSPFNTDDLPPEFETTPLWASGAGIGVQYAF